MKHLYFFLVASCLATAVMAQAGIPVNLLTPGQQLENISFEIDPLAINNQPLEGSTMFSINDISIQDSVYYYNGNGDEWNIFFRLQNLERNTFGNTTNYIQHYFDEDNSIWINKEKGVISYINDEVLREKFVKYAWNRKTGEWADTSYFEKRNETGNLLQLFSKNWDDFSDSFSFGFKNLYTQNENGQVTERIDLDWDSETQKWVNEMKVIQSYDNEGTLMQVSYKDWDEASFAWVNSSNHLYSWEGNDQTIIIQNWNSETNNWEDDVKYLFQYQPIEGSTAIAANRFNLLNKSLVMGPTDAKGGGYGLLLLLFKMFSMDPLTGQWANLYQVLYSYNTINLLILMISQNFVNPESSSSSHNITVNTKSGNSSVEGEWQNTGQTFFVYDNNENLTQEKNQNWDKDAEDWVDISQCDYVYNTNNDNTESYCKNWISCTNEWINNSRSYDFFDEEKGFRTWEYNQWWNTVENVWVNSYRTDYFWSSFVPVGVNINELPGISVYPNPTNGKIMINGDFLEKEATVKIYSITGKLMKLEVINSPKEMDINNLANGVYFVTVFSEMGTFRKKIVKE